MPKFPSRLRGGGDSSGVFELRPGLYSVRSRGRARAADALLVLHDDSSSTFAVYEGRPRGKAVGEEVGPVYSVGPGGPLAVPSGRVFVRLRENLQASEQRDHFAAAGFEIESTPSYAPHAAWLRPAEGGVGHALRALPALERIPGVVHVEPQMLLARARRGVRSRG
jgi:hypothetical protein